MDTKEGPCAICLEETITNPVILPCGHAFCFTCVGKYQISSDSSKTRLMEKEDAACPYCRGEVPNVIHQSLKRAHLYTSKTFSVSNGSKSNEQKKYAKLAVAEYDSALEIMDLESGVQLMQTMYAKGRVMTLAGKAEEAIEVAEKVLSLDKKYPGIMGFNRISQVQYWRGEAYSACEKWDDAVKIYISLFQEYVKRKMSPSTLIVMGMSRAMYETKKYDAARDMGSDCINVSRWIPGVHKYVALSHKALGDINEAKKIMSRAILYEAYWDEDNLQQNKELLQMLIAEEEVKVKNDVINPKSTKKRGKKKKGKGKK